MSLLRDSGDARGCHDLGALHSDEFLPAVRIDDGAAIDAFTTGYLSGYGRSCLSLATIYEGQNETALATSMYAKACELSPPITAAGLHLGEQLLASAKEVEASLF